MLVEIGSINKIKPNSYRLTRSYLKNVFEPKLGVGPLSQLLKILEYVCGLKLGPALI